MVQLALIEPRRAAVVDLADYRRRHPRAEQPDTNRKDDTPGWVPDPTRALSEAEVAHRRRMLTYLCERAVPRAGA